MPRFVVARLLGVVVAASVLLAGAPVGAGAVPVDAPTTPSPCPGGGGWTPYTREPEHATTTTTNVPIEMSDGVTLYADVVLPEGPGPFPTIVTQTAYSKDVLGGSEHFPPRGYAQVTVDLRGTGTSEGGWDPFSERERRDGFEVFEWVVDQPWSDGRTGGYGASYLGLTQIFAAAQQPEGLQAIFPIVPVADAYRDIVLMGGQVNVAFMPLWVALVTGLSVAPNSRWADDPAGAAQAVVDHLLRLVEPDSTVALIAKAALGDDEIVHDGPFWQERSPINHVGTVEVPTFITGGLNDLFQRGEPLLYEALKSQVPTKLLMGPWGHVEGSSGAGLTAAGLPAIEDIALRWFDHHLMDLDTRVDCIPDVTQWHWGAEEYRTQPDWPHPDLVAQPLYLGPGTLSPEPVTTEGRDLLPPLPLAGVCSRSTSQWLMGVLDGTPCAQDNRLNEPFEVQYTSQPLTEELVVNGPLAARLWLETAGPEAVVAVRVTDVAPDGTSRELTNGLQVASFREVDEARGRVVDGFDLQPWHPYTAESRSPMPVGEPTPVDVEILSTAAVVPVGHRIRVSVGASDVPHAVSPLPDLPGTLVTATRVVHGPRTPSYVVLPVVGPADAGEDGGAGGRPTAGDRPRPAAAPEVPGEHDHGRGEPETTPIGDAGRSLQARPAAAPLPVTGGSPGPVGLGLLVLLTWTLRRRSA